MIADVVRRLACKANSNALRGAALRYGATSVAVGSTILVLPLTPLGPAGWVVAILVLVACSWFGGVGPAVLAPFLMGVIHRWNTRGIDAALQLTFGEWVITVMLTLLTGALGWSGDMRRRAQALVRSQALKLQEQDRHKDRFLATLAHELRNPLAPIRTGLEILRMSGEPPTEPAVVLEVQEMMQRQVDHMIRLIDDLLDLSRINSGKIQLRRGKALLSDIIRDAIDASRPHIRAVGHELSVTLPDDPIVLEADRARLAQVVLNLLNNAAKFTRAGGQISLSAERISDAVEIRVRDSGVGIPRDMLSRVFDMFTQVEAPLERSTSGLGIGLSLVRTLVEMHGGTVEACSEGLGKGSEFIVRLPCQPSDEARDGIAVRPRLRSVVSRKILVVDDNKDAADSLTVLLTNTGHVCRTSYDGWAALETAMDFHPDVFVMDLGMPGMSGHELARRVRGIPEFQNALLIAVTGWNQDDDSRRSREAGFDHHLMKPVLISALQEVLDHRVTGAAPTEAMSGASPGFSRGF